MKERTLEIYTPDCSTRVELPLAAGTIQAAFPSPAEDFAEKMLDLNQLMIKHPASTFIARAKGDSMTGDGIASGDLLVVDKSVEAYSGCLAVCVLEGEFTLKRVEIDKEASCIWLVPSNAAYEPIRVEPEDEFTIWGVVTWVVKKM